jgi:hypothetical protein
LERGLHCQILGGLERRKKPIWDFLRELTAVNPLWLMTGPQIFWRDQQRKIAGFWTGKLVYAMRRAARTGC